MPSVYTFCLSLGMGTRVWLLRVHAAWQYFCFNPSLLVPPLSKTCPTPTNPYRGRSGECNKQGRTDFHTRRIHQLTSACPLPRNGTASKTGYRGHGKNVRLTRGGHCHTPRQLGCMSLPTDACEERLATHATPFHFLRSGPWAAAQEVEWPVQDAPGMPRNGKISARARQRICTKRKVMLPGGHRRMAVSKLLEQIFLNYGAKPRSGPTCRNRALQGCGLHTFPARLYDRRPGLTNSGALNVRFRSRRGAAYQELL